MERKTKNISLKAILIAIGVGIWLIVFQNAGVIPVKQNVYVKGGFVDVSGRVDVSGSVDVRNTVTVNGSVEVENTVDVNIHEINGQNKVTTDRGRHSVFPYGYMLPVESW